MRSSVNSWNHRLFVFLWAVFLALNIITSAIIWREFFTTFTQTATLAYLKLIPWLLMSFVLMLVVYFNKKSCLVFVPLNMAIWDFLARVGNFLVQSFVKSFKFQGGPKS